MNNTLLAIKERFLQELLVSTDRGFFKDGYTSPLLEEAIRYSLLNGGKRLRPLLVFASAQHEEPKGFFKNALPAALAVEYVHTFSLIHDDLPAMDDDDFRRGKLACHRQFQEGVAILAGDALLADAFALLAKAKIHPALQCLELALTMGRGGLVAGQVEDILSSKTAGSTWINLAKTARLFEASVVLGAIASGANRERIDFWRKLGRHFGLAFQALDDLMDAPSEEARIVFKNEKQLLIKEAQSLAAHSLFHDIVHLTFA